jgi:hypothetical protein
MKKFAILLGVLSSVPFAYAQPPEGAEVKIIPTSAPDLGLVREQIELLNNPLNKVDLSSPQNTVRSFVWAITNFDVAAARRCVF